MAKTLSQKNFMNFVKNKIVTGYSNTCELLICHVCKGTYSCFIYHVLIEMCALLVLHYGLLVLACILHLNSNAAY